MKHIKSERLKKLETELTDLEQWLKLGLVPKKDIDKHKEEIEGVKNKIEEEKERLQFLKESGEAEEYIAPKRPTTRAGYSEMPSMPDLDIEDNMGSNDSGFDMETDAIEVENTEEERDDDDDVTEQEGEEEDESYFSDRNRWRRGGIVDPDANDW